MLYEGKVLVVDKWLIMCSTIGLSFYYYQALPVTLPDAQRLSERFPGLLRVRLTLIGRQLL